VMVVFLFSFYHDDQRNKNKFFFLPFYFNSIQSGQRDRHRNWSRTFSGSSILSLSFPFHYLCKKREKIWLKPIIMAQF
jgi:hypothetical protein